MASTSGRRTYVIDTSVLLSDPHALRRFAEHDIVLPIVVITELEGKRHHAELGYFARVALRHLDDLRIEYGRLDAPVPVNDVGGTLHVELNHTDPALLPPGFRLGDNDSRILAVALNFRAEGHDVTLVSKDLPMRVKASAVGLTAEEYRAELAVESGWTGMTELEVGSEQVDSLYEHGFLDLEAARDLPCHTGVVLIGGQASALARVTPAKDLKLVKSDRDAFGLHGRSAEQRVALDLLLDPSIGIVSLGGRAGTGKSALALCAGLEAVLERRQHAKVVVFRPLYAVGGQELGYLPGTEGEKMAPWAQAVFDTLGAVTSKPVIEEVLERGPAGGAAADAHPWSVAARRVRDRGRGPVAGAQRAADGAEPDRPGLTGGADPRRRSARQPAGRSARWRGRGGGEAEGSPAVRPRDPAPLRALADRGAGHRDAGGGAALLR